MYLTGILQSLGIVFFSALFNVYIRVLSLYFTLDPIICTIFSFMSTAFILSFLGGPGKLVKGTLIQPSTWIYGLALSVGFALDFYIVRYVSGTEAGLFSRWAVPLCLVASFIILKRKPCFSDFLGSTIIIACMIYMIYIQPPENIITLLTLGSLLGLSIAFTALIPEIHKENAFAQEFGDIRLKIRVIGFAMLITSLLVVLIVILLCIVNNIFTNNVLLESIKPINFSIFKDYTSMIVGMFWGLLFSPLILYFSWSASYKTSAETVLMILSLIPVTTLGMEYGLSFFPIFDINMATFADGHGLKVLYIVILMTVGAGMSAYIKSYKKIKDSEGNTFWQKVKNSSKVDAAKLAISCDEANLADFEIIRNTVEFYEGDLQKASEVLELPIETMQTLMQTKNSYSLRKDISKKVHDIFRNKIFYLDQLTGVENRKGLIRQFATYQDEDVKFKLFYMDINKFKQINDTLGHDIGDIAIITTVHRIRDYAEKNKGFTYRLGGDEFAMMTTTEKSEEQVIEDIKAIVNQPIDYDESGNKGTLNPSISIGKANVIKDAEVKIKDLIKSADENMYKDKQSSKDEDEVLV